MGQYGIRNTIGSQMLNHGKLDLCCFYFSCFCVVLGNLVNINNFYQLGCMILECTYVGLNLSLHLKSNIYPKQTVLHRYDCLLSSVFVKCKQSLVNKVLGI